MNFFVPGISKYIFQSPNINLDITEISYATASFLIDWLFIMLLTLAPIPATFWSHPMVGQLLAERQIFLSVKSVVMFSQDYSFDVKTESF